MIIERLSYDNFNKFNELLNLAKERVKYRLDFYEFYSEKSFIIRYLIRKNTRLIVINNEYIGYIWSERKSNNTVAIKDMYIKDNYINILNAYFLKILSCQNAIYESFENPFSLNILKIINMKKIKNTNIMRYDILSLKGDKDVQISKYITFQEYLKKRDSKIRCILQNDIFENQNRFPLTIDDIYFDEKQEYFLDDMNLFMKYNNNYIGYGQIIYSRGIYMIVNFGIIKEYRHKGFGSILLKRLIKLMKEKINEDIYIRVDSSNFPAKNLYKKVGFNDEGIISTWIYEN